MIKSEEVLGIINGHNIKMIKSDYFDETVQKKTNDIISVMTTNSTLERILIECISAYYISTENTSYEEFIKRIENEKLNYPNFIFELIKFKDIYSGLLQNKNNEKIINGDLEEYCKWVNKIRGSILESITEKKAMVNKKQYMTGCYIEINTKKIKRDDKQSVDFAGHDDKEFQIYECKMTPNGFDTSDGITQINLLLDLNDEFSKCKIDSKLFCVTAGSRSKLEVTLKKLLSSNHSRVTPIGGVELNRAISF